MPVPGDYVKLSVYATYELGPDGYPLAAKLHEGITAIGDVAVRSMPYTFDTTEVERVEVMVGGTASAVRPAEDLPGFSTVDIVFNKPIAPGTQHNVGYTTVFKPNTELPNEFRYAAAPGGRLIRHLDLAVNFDERRLPSNRGADIWQATWDQESMEIDPGTQQRVKLQKIKIPGITETMQARLSRVNPEPGTLLGFYWQFPA